MAGGDRTAKAKYLDSMKTYTPTEKAESSQNAPITAKEATQWVRSHSDGDTLDEMELEAAFRPTRDRLIQMITAWLN